MTIENLRQTFPRHILHDDPVIALVIGLDVVKGNEVLVFQVDALLHAAQFDLGIATNEFKRNFLARFGNSVVDFAETALTNATLDDIAAERSVAGRIDELCHDITL